MFLPKLCFKQTVFKLNPNLHSHKDDIDDDAEMVSKLCLDSCWVEFLSVHFWKRKNQTKLKGKVWIWWEQLQLFNNGILSLFYYIYCCHEFNESFFHYDSLKKSLPQSSFSAKITKFAEKPTTCSLLLLIFGVFRFLGHLVPCSSSFYLSLRLCACVYWARFTSNAVNLNKIHLVEVKYIIVSLFFL